MLELLALPFFQRALIVGILLGIVMALLGVLVVLRHMSFFSDAIGHSALAGIAVGLLFNINPFLGAFIFSILVALAIANLRAVTKLSLDTLLGVFFSAAVSLGVIIVSLTPGYQADLLSFLFGNILTVSQLDVVLSTVIVLLVIGIFFFKGKNFMAITFDRNLAKAEGIAVQRYEVLLMLMLAIVTALAIKIVGVLLVTALLVVPAASAQYLAKSLTSMFIISQFVGITSVIIGMLVSAYANLPSGPTIVMIATGWFILTLASSRVLGRG